MATSRDQEIMNALMAKLYAIMSAGDTIHNVSSDAPYISFASPGIPLASDDIDFGFLSQNPKQFVAAADFSTLVNSIPAPTGFWSSSQSSVIREYEKVIKQVVLPNSTLTQQEQISLGKEPLHDKVCDPPQCESQNA